MTFLVGLTGGIGSGKSEVAGAFAARGVDVLDADEIAHAISKRGEAGHRAVVESLGRAFLRDDGELDRAALRRRAFDDPTFRRDLEHLLHPLIVARLEDAIGDFRGPYGMLVVPLLLERGGLRKRVNRVLVVDCPEQEQIRRVQLRSGSPKPTTSSTIPGRAAPSSRRLRASTGAIATSPRSRARRADSRLVGGSAGLGQNEALMRKLPS